MSKRDESEIVFIGIDYQMPGVAGAAVSIKYIDGKRVNLSVDKPTLDRVFKTIKLQLEYDNGL